MIERPEVVRTLGRATLVALVLNCILGSGVFALPGAVAGRLGWAGLLAWVVASAITGVVLLCFAEVASRFQGAGGPYLYTQAAFGRFAGLQIGWMTYFARAITAAVQANLFTTYLAELWPWAGTRPGSVTVTTLFFGVPAAINLRGVRSGARVSDLFALAKLVPLVAFGALGIAWLVRGGGVPERVASDPSAVGWLEVLLLLIFAFGGFEAALIPLGEAKNPRRDAPFALLSGLALVTLIYLAAQLTVLATLDDPGASTRPLADSARVLLGEWGAVAMAIGALVSVTGWLAGSMLNVPRLTLAMAERGDLPAWMGRIHPRTHVPHVSILVFAALSWGLANQAGLYQNLSLSAVSRLLGYGAVCAALVALRIRDRGDDRGGGAETGSGAGPALFRAPAGLVLAGIGMAAAAVLASRMNLREALTLLVTALVATVHWALIRRRDSA